MTIKKSISKKSSSKKSAKSYAKKSVKSSSKKSAKSSAKKSVKSSSKKSAKSSTKKAAKSSAKKVAKSSVKKLAKSSSKKAAKSSAKKMAKSSAKKAAKSSAKKIAKSSECSKKINKLMREKKKIIIKLKKKKVEDESKKSVRATQFAIDYRSGISNYDMRTKTRTVRSYLDKKYNPPDARSKRLYDLSWGFGIEHEVHFFHVPEPPEDNPRRISSKFDKITNFIIFDGFNSTVDIELKYYRDVHPKDYAILEKIPYETSGRWCNHKWVLENTLLKGMPEFITGEPFSSLKTSRRTVEEYCDEIIDKEKTYVETQNINPITRKRIDRYGLLAPYPFGMSNFIVKPINNKAAKYEFVKNKKGEIKNHTDYTGSYHITMTLPFNNAKMEQTDFIKMHENFANHIQWLEPLLLTSFFSSDQRAVGTLEKRVRGSFRVMRVGWGNLGGSDIRKFNQGIGRYANIEPLWRKGLYFKDIDKLKYCSKPKQEPGAISALSSNFRTFGSTDPDRPQHRESGAGMTKPNGIEIRIFDHFNSSHLKDLCRLLVYIAAHSKHNKCTKYVYKNKDWIDAVQSIMKYGWKANLTDGYINEMRKQFNLPIKTKSLRAFDIMWQINSELFERNKSEDIPFLMLKKEYSAPPELPHINRRSWEMGFLIKLNMDEKLLTNFNKLLYILPDATISYSKYKKYFYDLFPKNRWKENIDDIIYFFKYKGLMNVEMTPKGQIKNIKILKSNISHFNNTNRLIYDEWYGTKFFKDYYKKIIIEQASE